MAILWTFLVWLLGTTSQGDLTKNIGSVLEFKHMATIYVFCLCEQLCVIGNLYNLQHKRGVQTNPVFVNNVFN